MVDETKEQEQVNTQPEQDIIPVVSIGIIKGKNELAISGMLGNPDLCISACADAIKMIVGMGKPTQPKSGIVTPKKPDLIVPR
jgi:hypothetical protein